MSQPKYKIVISGGGTGGHIFPAIAIANALKAKAGESRMLFIGAQGRMEMEKVPAAGYQIKGLWISGLSRKLSFSTLIFPLKLAFSILKARKILKQFKPDAVIGVGGYASGPTLLAAVRLGIPTLIQEQNAFAGITNRWLGKAVDRICVAHTGMEKFFPENKIVVTGNPIRKEMVNIKDKRKRAATFFGLNPDKLTILVIGGSQGARSINLGIQSIIDLFEEHDLQLIWQTGKGFHEEAQAMLNSKQQKRIKPLTFIYEMDLAYAMSDIIISRAGAIAIAEICAVGKPVILVPLPTAAEDHQTRNADALVKKDAAILVPNDQVMVQLKPAVLELVNSKPLRDAMGAAALQLANIDADEHIASEVIQLITHSKNGKRKDQ